MFEAGAHSFFTKQVQKKPFEELLESIIRNERYISASAAANYTFHMNQLIEKKPEIEEPVDEETNAFSVNVRLTNRERQVIRFIWSGLTDKEIAQKMTISSRTVGSHKRHIFEKTGTRKATELIALAYQMNLIK
jgi:DNA-binding NarL/FixJ family response regulator